MNVNDYIGMPYSLRPTEGHLNCWELVAKVFHDEFSEELPEYNADTVYDVGAAFTAAFAVGDHGFTRSETYQDFSVIIMSNKRKKVSSIHCGIVYGGMVLHSSGDAKQVVYQPIAHATREFKEVEFWQR
jgi:cell wall-associated NlpC family hydrolase